MFVLLVLFLAFGAQVALSDKFKFNFTTINQCEPVSISFSGSENADAIPSSLTLIPFGSRPFSIPIPPTATNSTGVTVSFLPLEAGTQFIASLDDETGDNSAKVSDVFRVFPSSTGDRSCLPAAIGTPLFTLPTSVAQCEVFNIGYTSAKAPTVRVFSPRGGSFQLDPFQDSAQVASYTLNVNRQASVVIMAFTDTVENGSTSQLLTVGGDSSSSKTCFAPKDNNKDKDKGNSKNSSQSTSPMSNAVAIGLGVGGGVVLLVTLLLALFLIRRRRQQRLARNLDFNPALLEKRSSFTKSEYSGQQPGPGLNYSAGSFVQNPPYTTSRFSRSSGNYSVPSWNPPSPQGLKRSGSQQSATTDIEHILNYVAEQHSDDYDKAVPPPIREPSPTQSEPPRVLTPRGRHEGHPSGVPLSAVGGTPRESFASSANFEMVSRPSQAAFAPSPSRLKAPPSRFSDPSLMDGGSIGDFPRPPFVERNNVARDSNASWGNLGSGR